MAFYIIWGLFILFAGFLAFSEGTSKNSFGSDVWNFLQGVFFFSIAALGLGLVMTIASYGWSDFKPKSSVSYDLVENANIAVLDENLKTVIIGADGKPEAKIFTAGNIEVTGNSKVTVDEWERTAPGWVPWPTGVAEFVKVS